VAAVDRRQRLRVVDREVVGARHHDAADRGEGLRPAEHGLAPARVGEELGEPGHCGTNSTDTPTNVVQRKKSSIRCRGREAGGERRERVEQDAPHQNAPAAEDVGQVAAEQAEGAAGERPAPRRASRAR
jgi:hypothetical protein